jgi:glycerol-3-phosphate dehydrogenase (NAD(P)+)
MSGETYAVIGGGSWATSLCKILMDNACEKQILWWVRTEEKAEYIRTHGHNPDYISAVSFDTNRVELTHDLNWALEQADVLILAIPSAFIQGELEKTNKSLWKGKKVLTAVKGLIPKTHEVMHQYLKRQFGLSEQDIAYVTGPCHAEEVALERLSYLTIASENEVFGKLIEENMECAYVRTCGTTDIIGTEYSSVLKNIYAIVSGICHGLGYGDNFQAILVSNAIQEMEVFLNKMEPTSRIINASAYLGDLLVTAYSTFSRNRTFGNMLGKGYSVHAAQMEMNMIAEGYYACKSIYLLNENLGAHMPILDFAYQVLYEGKSARKSISGLIPKLK